MCREAVTIRYRMSDVVTNVCANVEKIARLVCIRRLTLELYMSGFRSAVEICTMFATHVPVSAHQDTALLEACVIGISPVATSSNASGTNMTRKERFHTL